MIDYINKKFGTTYPIGATYYRDIGVNFSLYSKSAQGVELLLFDHPEDSTPSAVIALNPSTNRTFYYWHFFVEGIKPGQLYGYRVIGENKPEAGMRYDPEKLLIDPYARAIVSNGHYSRDLAKIPGNNTGKAMKCAVIDPYDFAWEGDTPLKRPYSETIIYEMHVAGFTANPNSGVPDQLRGKYKGIIEKIPYLVELGITAVELMPVQQFDPQDAVPPLVNYWGYSPIAFFAPHNAYSMSGKPVEAVNEFREMVKVFHKAGIEVILDVVFNHTAEAGADGPVFSLRGIENKTYYTLDPDDPSHYLDYTGCGNTLNANHSIVRRMIMDCLKSWVTEFHVDGFRFDLASVLSRDEYGEPLKNPPVLWEIESDPVMSGTKIIAEAWDAAGLYQVGSFVGDRWAEWNGKYRDHVRKFMRGDRGMISKFASKIIASPDIYPDPDREPNRSIHFITCHDGFTLHDLVTYNEKHNLANLESNRDGSNHNFSWNSGAEGETDILEINELRVRQTKNFLSLVFLSQGTPMLLMGDEVRRTQSGNNNAYCQDNPTSWFDWDLVERNTEIHRFTKGIISLTQSLKVFQIEKWLSDPDAVEGAHITWHGVKIGNPDWSENSHSLAFTLHYPEFDEKLHIMVNAWWQDLTFELPHPEGGRHWHRIVNTFLKPPHDFSRPDEADVIDAGRLVVNSRSVVVLMSK